MIQYFREMIQTYNKGLKYDKNIAQLEEKKKQLEQSLDTTKEEMDKLEKKLANYKKKCKNEKAKYQQMVDNLQSQVEDLKLDAFGRETELEKFCEKRYEKANKIAYAKKRLIEDEPVAIYMNELITPDAYKVEEFFKDTDLKSGSIKQIAERIGDKMASDLIWKSDRFLKGEGDYYLYPNEILSLGWGDCEDHAYVACSAYPDIGGAWGFYRTDKEDDWGGHAFNVFVYNDELYVLETTGNRGKIYRYEDTEKYKIHYIITKNKTFILDDSARFGRNP